MTTSDKETPIIRHLAETESTNQYLRELMQTDAPAEGSLVWADFQTAGKGQVGNHWESENGANLTFSLLLYPDFLPANRQFLISQITALAVKATLDGLTDDITIKWPNDIYWKNKKIGGMLIENDLSGAYIYASVLGIGLNINQAHFESNAPNPVSLHQITGQYYDREALLHTFLTHFSDYYFRLIQGEEEQIRAAYRAALFRGTGSHTYADPTGRFEAEIVGIESTGHLLLQLVGGETRRYAFKEVSIVL